MLESCKDHLVLYLFIVLVVGRLMGVVLVEKSNMAIKRRRQKGLFLLVRLNRPDLLFMDLNSVDQFKRWREERHVSVFMGHNDIIDLGRWWLTLLAM